MEAYAGGKQRQTGMRRGAAGTLGLGLLLETDESTRGKVLGGVQ